MLEVFRDHVLESLWLLLLQEPNTMATQLALCICLRNWKAKLVVPIYFGTKTSKFCFKIFSLSSLESELSFDWEEFEISIGNHKVSSSTWNYFAQSGLCNFSFLKNSLAPKNCRKMFLEAIFFAFEKTFFRVSVQNFCHCFTQYHWPTKFLIVFLPIIIQNYDV